MNSTQLLDKYMEVLDTRDKEQVDLFMEKMANTLKKLERAGKLTPEYEDTKAMMSDLILTHEKNIEGMSFKKPKRLQKKGFFSKLFGR